MCSVWRAGGGVVDYIAGAGVWFAAGDAVAGAHPLQVFRTVHVVGRWITWRA